ncbi:UDP-glucose 4-epimerase GalE [Oceanobacillus arenosus]|uniref:UDP-glucose 4-epimerase n=1 Tax=Oceanobacillus arenosus TaxID=1229153 RepID=A0A3D8Q3I7_9BACI|nr:UDP-glucose 4-epimerase GalE [Oceanobacillus arenosus]RDW22408.1 UDP-glucose 4-epimerase GalE [Oceanobacillus arenosus]
MAILVTGGAGYIGTHTCVELLNGGYDIIVVDNFSNSNPQSLKRVSEITGKTFPIYEADLLEKEDMMEIFAENEIEAVVHFAGLKSVGESVSVPLHYYQNNITSTIILCEVMQQFGVKKIVFSSSATVYGITDNMPITEDTTLQAINPYGRTKHMIEEILGDVAFADPSWSIAILRYFNPIGAHESGRIGEDPNGIPNNLMPYISQVAVGKRKQLQVFGDDYPTKDGTGVRDYIHVTDLAIGHLRALERVQMTTEIEAFNLGTGFGYSVLEMVTAFEKAAGVAIPYQLVDRRPGDSSICYADVTKARKELNWKAIRGIEKMCEDTWRWQRENPDGYAKVIKKNKNQKTPVRQSMGFFNV